MQITTQIANRVSNIDIILPSGSESRKIIQGTIKWHPQGYNPEIINGKQERPIKLTIDNGSPIKGDGEIIAPSQSVDFQVKRNSLDKSFTLSVNIDNRSGDILTYPPVTKYGIGTRLRTIESTLLMRNDNKGLDAAALDPVCVVPKDEQGMLLPSTAKTQKTGGGVEWDARTKVTITESNPLRICIVVSSEGAGCRNKCDHQVKGYLSVMEAFFSPVK